MVLRIMMYSSICYPRMLEEGDYVDNRNIMTGAEDSASRKTVCAVDRCRVWGAITIALDLRLKSSQWM